MRKSDAVMVDRAQRTFVAAVQEQKDAAHRFSLAREAKRRAEADLVAALDRAGKPGK